MTGVLGRWGDDSELPIVLDIIRSLYRNAEKVGGGLNVYLNIRSYPAVLVFSAYGIGLIRAERWHALHRLFSATIDRRYDKPIRAVESLFLGAWKGTENNAWKQIEGLEKQKTPLSERDNMTGGTRKGPGEVLSRAFPLSFGLFLDVFNSRRRIRRHSPRHPTYSLGRRARCYRSRGC
jgi:hypothetical protein